MTLLLMVSQAGFSFTADDTQPELFGYVMDKITEYFRRTAACQRYPESLSRLLDPADKQYSRGFSWCPLMLSYHIASLFNGINTRERYDKV